MMITQPNAADGPDLGGEPRQPLTFRSTHTSRWSELGNGNTPTSPNRGSVFKGQK